MHPTSSLRACRRAPWVGRVWFDWVDPGRAEVYSSTRDRRELVVWIWYPATRTQTPSVPSTCPEPWVPSGQFLGLDAVGLLSHAVADAPVAGEQPAIRCWCCRPAGSRRCCWRPSPSCASHGYVVVGSTIL